MTERLSDDQLTRLRKLVEHDDLRVAASALRGSSWPLDLAQRMEERADRFAHAVDALPDLLAEIDRLRALLTDWQNRYGDAESHAVELFHKIDRLRADLEAAELEVYVRGETIKAQKADMDVWAVRWQEQFERAERAVAAGPGSSQPADCPSDAAAGLRGTDEAPLSVCPHASPMGDGP